MTRSRDTESIVSPWLTAKTLDLENTIDWTTVAACSSEKREAKGGGFGEFLHARRTKFNTL